MHNFMTKTDLDFIRHLVAKGGPDVEDYPDFEAWVSRLKQGTDAGLVSETDKRQIEQVFGDALTCETMQGFAYRKPHGYPGDFEIIDRIYTHWKSPREDLRKWDDYFHQQVAPEAVRNRKNVFCRCIDDLGQVPKRILNLASGPARDVYDWMGPEKPRHHITCLDMDPKSVQYAKELVREKHQSLNGNSPDITFIVGNAVRYRAAQKYDLIWSGGLFDYFSDRVFVAMLKKFRSMINPGGGNYGWKFWKQQSIASVHGIGGGMGFRAPNRGTASWPRPFGGCLPGPRGDHQRRIRRKPLLADLGGIGWSCI
ncbi:MAG: class I SAM-dependent methyltransferase [Kiritimatiellae bacterium]|nr:class I SAM-dependent methyltransferase [Kiritimatiellia bacterium]